MTRVYFIAFFLSLLLAFFLTPMIRKLSRFIGLVDNPGGRKIHAHPMPSGGGIVLFSAFLITLWITISRMNLLFPDPGRLIAGFFLGGLFIIVLGIVDDIRDLRPIPKLCGQIIAALILYAVGFRFDILSNPLGEYPIELGYWSLLFTILWVISLINAINLIDGLDGLAAGVCFIVSLTLGFIGWHQGELQVMFLSLIFSGAILGFLRYNFYPASIFLGDSGSMFLGFSLAAISLMGAHKSTTAMALLFPLVVGLMVPVIDTTSAIIRRLWSKAPIFTGDKKHLHHRLLQLGIPHRHVVTAFYYLTFYLCIIAFTFVVIEMRYSLIIIALLALGLYLAFRVLYFLEEQLLPQLEPGSPSATVSDKVKSVPDHPVIFFWEESLERITEKILLWTTVHKKPVLILIFIPLVFFIISHSVYLNQNLARKLVRDSPQDLIVNRGLIPGEWNVGFAVRASDYELPDYTGDTLKVYSQNDMELPVLPYHEHDTPQGIWIPLTLSGSETSWQCQLYRSSLFRFFRQPQDGEYKPDPMMQTSGTNIILWKRENITRDGTILPVIGNFMTRITLQVRPVTGDHFTNDLIGYCQFTNFSIYKDSYLQYYLRAGDDFPRSKHLADMRFSVQAMIDGEPTDLNMASDQHGKSGSWETDLTAEAVGRWYFRRIPLGQFAGNKISSLYLMINDDPALEPSHPIFQEDRKGYFHFYFDGIAIVRGDSPSLVSK
ncbi:MraY family glycosyltransferase [candidate division CSSED10-310 bacterium]|uniref:MraY family glycosyltransferase n=1 Tax=candidate division CSSED10-310 bacterium TaxID=2855610 RepID=A0ABV6YX38_UNCC1